MTQVAVGDTGGFEFRTRSPTATLMYLIFTNDTGVATLEFSLYRSNLQVIFTETSGSWAVILFILLNETSTNSFCHLNPF